MNLQRMVLSRHGRVLVILLMTPLVACMATAALAQGYGAIQAVRQRVEGLSGGPGSPAGEAGPSGQKSSNVPSAKVDLTYVPSNVAMLAIIRPSQIFTSPMSQILPTEVAAAASRMSLGMDPADIDEIIQFVDLSSPGMPALGAVSSSTNLFGPTICRRTW